MKQKTLLSTAIAAALVLQTWSAIAQDAPPASADAAKNLQTITVTGSRIRSVDVETAQPVFTMDRAQIKATGLTNVNDILQRMPSVGTPDISPQDALSSGTSVGGRYTDIRNLGSARTLVLVNGRRWSTNLDGLTDLSTIPVSIIDHIDVLKDGASSVYGSDAIAGVVNIITRDHFDGAEANVSYGRNQGPGGSDREADFTFGHSTGKSSFIFNGSYDDTDPVMDRSRSLTAFPRGPRHPGDAFGLGPYGKVTDPVSGDAYVINHGPNGVGNPANFGDYHLFTGDNSDLFNTNNQTTFRSGSKLKNLFAQERYNLTDNLTLRLQGNYSTRQSVGQLAGYPLQTATTGLVIDPDNAYNPFPGQETEFARRTIELPRVTDSRTYLTHYDAGLEGFFTFLDHDWNWDASYDYSKTRISQNSSGNIYLPNAQNALGPTDTIDGQVVCASAAARAEGCVPWNILAGPGGTPQSVLNYVNYNGNARAKAATDDFTANVSGGLFDWQGGTVSIAGGIEHRGEKGSFTPDPNDSAGLTTNLASAPTKGAYNVNEAYLELDVPLLKDLPGAQELGVNVASRYSHYSNFGSTTNNKYSFRWKPFQDLLVRGTYAQGLRAPTINDLFSGTGQSFESFTDPCDSLFGASADSAAVASRCRAAGVPANYRQVDQAGNLITSNAGGQTPTPFLSGSNPNLKPETAITRTLGLVYSPNYVQGLDVSLDWYKVRIKNIISTVDAQTILDYCYVQNDPSFCGRFNRAADGSIAFLNESLANLGSESTEGYDFGIHYRLPETRFGSFGIRSDSTYLKSFESNSGPGATTISDAGFMDGATGLFRIRSNLSLDWKYQAFSATWTVRYYSGLKDDCYTDTEECNMPTYTNPWIGKVGISQKGGVAFNDAQFAYTAPWKGTFSIGVNNLFNRKGPLYYSVVTAGTGSPPYSPVMDFDRYYFVSYSQKF
jgi:iron complex outermembrane receptor protein